MSRTPAINVSNPYTEVDLQRLSTKYGEVPKYEVLVKDDKGDWNAVNTVSEGYQLIKNELVSNVIEDIKTRSGYEWHPLKDKFFDGKRYMEYWMSDNDITTIKAKGGFNRTMKIGLMGLNSYDGSSSFRLLMFMCALECSNQFISQNRFGSFILRHLVNKDGSNEFNVQDACERISTGAQELITFAPMLKKLQSKTLELKDFQYAKTSTEMPRSRWGDVLDKIEHDSVWGLYNALTDVASNNMQGLQSLSINEQIGQAYLESGVYIEA